MKRDLNLCRNILTSLEDEECYLSGFAKDTNPFRDGCTLDEFQYHLILMAGPDLEWVRITPKEDGVFMVSITWEGHEALALMQDDEMWDAIYALTPIKNWKVMSASLYSNIEEKHRLERLNAGA